MIIIFCLLKVLFDGLTTLKSMAEVNKVQECFFCSSYFLSPYFSKYTNDETLKTNFKFIDPPPPKYKRIKINHISVQFLHRDFFSVAYSIWVRRVASAYLLSEPTIFLGKCLYQVRNVLFFCCSVD